ncbi:MAG: hypothetical protein HGB34_03495 [Candidatus Moranbacteria bacterium]|nr:hypothetical protein [Candidatus Moranbacteria bacterium]NTW75939.1 hypothetical protein [Candidatus Moranbacteria bacterium]
MHVLFSCLFFRHINDRSEPERFLKSLDAFCSEIGTRANNVFASGIVRTTFECYRAITLAFDNRLPHLCLQAYDAPNPYGFFQHSMRQEADTLVICLSADVFTFEALRVRYVVDALINQGGTHIIRTYPTDIRKTAYFHPLESDGLERLLMGNPTLGMSAKALRALVRRHPLPPFRERTLSELIHA